MKQADLGDMFKEASKNVCISTIVVFPDPPLLLHPILQLRSPEKTAEEPDEPE
jgi:hypothetical protein